MKSIEESVVIAMDSSDAELHPFLPYILQDQWEQALPESYHQIDTETFDDCAGPKVFDSGSGK